MFVLNILETKSKGTISISPEELKNLNLIIQEKGFNTSSKFYLTNISDENFSVTKVLKQVNSSPLL